MPARLPRPGRATGFARGTAFRIQNRTLDRRALGARGIRFPVFRTGRRLEHRIPRDAGVSGDGPIGPATLRGPPLPWVELGALVGVGAAFATVFLRVLATAPLEPLHDPYMVESLHHHT